MSENEETEYEKAVRLLEADIRSLKGQIIALKRSEMELKIDHAYQLTSIDVLMPVDITEDPNVLIDVKEMISLYDSFRASVEELPFPIQTCRIFKQCDDLSASLKILIDEFEALPAPETEE